MTVKFTNNASATLATSLTIASTTVQVTSGQGAQFPALTAGQYFYGTLVDSSNNLEIIKVTARAGDTLTVVRGQDGTTPHAYLAGDRFELRLTSAALNLMVQLEGNQTVAGVKTFSDGIVSNVTGNLTGNVTGNLTGNTAGTHTGPVTGDVTGNVTGNLTGNVTGTADVAKALANSNWSVAVSGGNLVFSYNGVNKFIMYQNGMLKAANDVAGFQSL